MDAALEKLLAGGYEAGQEPGTDSPAQGDDDPRGTSRNPDADGSAGHAGDDDQDDPGTTPNEN